MQPVADSPKAAPQTPPLLGPLDAIPGYVCSVCGGSFPVDKVFDQEGSIICERCHAAAASFAATPDEAAPGSFPAVPTLSTLMALPQVDDLAPPTDGGPVADPASEPDTKSPAAAAAANEVDDTIAELGAVSASALRTRRPQAEKKLPIPMLIASGVIALVLAGIITYRVTRYGGSPGGAAPSSDSGSPGPAEASAGDQPMSDWEQHNAPRFHDGAAPPKAWKFPATLPAHRCSIRRC